MRTCLWNKPPELSVRVAFAEFEWKCHNFLSKKMGNWDRKILLFRYWKYLVLGLGEVYFLEVDAYLSLKRATTSVWEGHFCWIWVKIPQYFECKGGGLGSKVFIAKLLKWSYLRLIRHIYFLGVDAYVSLKRVATSVWECRFCWIWVKIPQSFNIKTREWNQKIWRFNYWKDLILIQ